jgi:hypothetical protein
LARRSALQDLEREKKARTNEKKILDERLGRTTNGKTIQTSSINGDQKASSCKDCKYYRKVIAKEGSIKELEIAKLKQELEQTEAEKKEMQTKTGEIPKKRNARKSGRAAFAERTNIGD